MNIPVIAFNKIQDLETKIQIARNFYKYYMSVTARDLVEAAEMLKYIEFRKADIKKILSYY
jgi:hypothetical protein